MSPTQRAECSYGGQSSGEYVAAPWYLISSMPMTAPLLALGENWRILSVFTVASPQVAPLPMGYTPSIAPVMWTPSVGIRSCAGGWEVPQLPARTRAAMAIIGSAAMRMLQRPPPPPSSFSTADAISSRDRSYRP